MDFNSYVFRESGIQQSVEEDYANALAKFGQTMETYHDKEYQNFAEETSKNRATPDGIELMAPIPVP